MFRIVLILFLIIAGFPFGAFAYEFNKIDTFFNLLEQNYTVKTDLKSLVVKGCAGLSKFDDNLKLYASDSKAFLYRKQNLIATFDFPQNENLEQWKYLLCDIYSTAAKYSSNLSQNGSEFENDILNLMAHHLDKYSRLDVSASPTPVLNTSVQNNILYVRSQNFYDGFTDDLKKLIYTNPDIEGLILDLRDNHGGSFNEALKTADLFLDGALITYRIEKNTQRQKFYTADKGDILTNKPIVILTSEHTASAAEIVVAALSEQSRATLIGTKTYGKGSIQKVHNFAKETLYLTSGYFYSPSGKTINESGIFPQICTGINHGCNFSDQTNPKKDILTAINFIKKNLG
ncbi:MAG: hypothetical protein J6C85_00995 [Alphaproteobacteria bacterium]|nr:hypothetical protein [Alphaproteobacteria bacterium]